MTAFNVWTRSLANASRVRVEGSKNAHWLLGRLSQSFMFKSSEPMHEDRDSNCFTFQVLYGSQHSRSSVERLLAGIPEVKLLAEPA